MTMHHRIRSLVQIAFCLVLFVSPRLQAAVLYVGGDGFATIQEAVDNAEPGDHIVIAAGTYNESVDLSRMGSAIEGGQPGDLSLWGRRGVTIHSSSGKALFNDSAFAGNLLFYGLGFTSDDNTGLDLRFYDGRLVIVNCSFNDCGENGLELCDTTGSIWVLWSDFLGSLRKGIRLERTENATVRGSLIDGEFISIDDGIRGLDVNNVSIRNCTIRRVGSGPAEDGIDLKDPTGKVVIQDNLIEDTGDDAMMIEANDATSLWTKIAGNLIVGNPGTTFGGIELRTRDEGRIRGLVLDNELIGINGHCIEVAVKDDSQQSVAISGNAIESTYESTAVFFEAIGTSQTKISYSGNKIQDTLGDALRVAAEDTAVLSVEISSNGFRNIGDGPGDAAIQIQPDDAATINALVNRNRVRNVRGYGLYTRGRGDSFNNLWIRGNAFRNTNLASGDAGVLIDDEDAGDNTLIDLRLHRNSVLETNGAAAYELRQQDPGVFNIFGTEATAQEVVENNNEGTPVVITGTIHVVQ